MASSREKYGTQAMRRMAQLLFFPTFLATKPKSIAAANFLSRASRFPRRFRGAPRAAGGIRFEAGKTAANVFAPAASKKRPRHRWATPHRTRRRQLALRRRAWFGLPKSSVAKINGRLLAGRIVGQGCQKPIVVGERRRRRW